MKKVSAEYSVCASYCSQLSFRSTVKEQKLGQRNLNYTQLAKSHTPVTAAVKSEEISCHYTSATVSYVLKL